MGILPDKFSTAEAWNELWSRWNEAVIQGKHSLVTQEIKELNFKHIPRSMLYRLADVAYRSNDSISALQILHSVIHPENRFQQPATPQEHLIYASALTQLGAVSEALILFDQIDAESLPDVLLRKSFALFKIWDYRASLPLLKAYILRANLTPYQKLIGQVNLAAALIFETDWSNANQLLSEVIQECEKNSYTLLLGNCLELKAQIDLFCGRYHQAVKNLEKAKNYLKDQKGDYLFFVEKWLTICECFIQQSPEALQNLHKLKQKAKSLRQWENMRDCDLFESMLTQNQSLSHKLIIGTPHKIYHQRVRRLFGKNLQPQGDFHLLLGSNPHSEKKEVFDPYGQQQIEPLYKKSHLLSLFQALTKDFYKPSHIGLLFERIYPEEKFDPFHSPSRVLQLLRRLNQWFIDNKISLQVVMEKSEFYLDSLSEKTVEVIIRRSQKLSKKNGQILTLKHTLKQRTFTTAVAAKQLDISRVSAQSLINKALSSGVLKKNGVGRSTVYQFITAPSRKISKEAA